MSSILKYFEALERLKKNESIIVPIGIKINNDSVSLEAGKSKGSIKKSRIIFTELIKAINDASKFQSQSKLTKNNDSKKLNADIKKFKYLYEQSLGVNLQLVKRLRDLELEIKKLSFKNIIKITDKY